MIAIAEADSNKQMEWNQKALALAEKSQDPKANGWLGPLYNNMAWTYHGSEKFEEALALFKKGQTFRESKGDASATRIAKWSVARTLRSLKRYDEALAIQSALKSEFEALGEKDPYVFEELGELSLLLAKIDDAKEFFRLAYNQFSKDESFKSNEAPRFERIHELSLKR
jgi:tetratricopeptide (TPR) repeat protein